MSDYEKIRNELSGHRYIKVEPVGGNPPEKYLVTYRVKGLRWDENQNRPTETDFHQVEIYLVKSYPREKPKCEMKTDIFHPNIKGQVCISDYWTAGENLVDVIIQIGEMIQYQSYNPKSPLDARAARWSRQNEDLFPIDNVDLYQPEPEIEFCALDNDIDIELMEKLTDNYDDIEIDLL